MLTILLIVSTSDRVDIITIVGHIHDNPETSIMHTRCEHHKTEPRPEAPTKYSHCEHHTTEYRPETWITHIYCERHKTEHRPKP